MYLSLTVRQRGLLIEPVPAFVGGRLLVLFLNSCCLDLEFPFE